MPIKPLSFKGDKKSSKKRKHPSSSDQLEQATSSTAPSEDDTWTHPSLPTDLTGPILLVIPSTPPSALTADSLGAVFTTPLENIIDSSPFTAEPHDVRQVWIASRVAGSEELSFKGSHGGYLACEAGSGVISARREARGREEGWVVEVVVEEEEGKDVQGQDGRLKFQLKSTTSSGEEAHYLSAVASSASTDDSTKTPKITLRGDGVASSPSTHLILRMQSRFKPQLQAQKTQKASEKISRRELEAVVGRKLEDDEVKRLKRARRDGTYHEEILDVRVKGKHDKFAS